MATVLDALQWRYATKRMNGEPVEQKMIDQILEAARLAPSSMGLQPVVVFDITNQELKKQIQPVANNQSQITDCSHLLVFTAWDNYTAERIEKRCRQTVAERSLPEHAMDDYKNHLLQMAASRPAEINFAHTARQAYIAFGAAIIAAAELKIDATPMEGFDNAALDKLLELNKYGLKSVTLLPVGYRDAKNDWLVNLKKVRAPKEEFVIELK